MNLFALDGRVAVCTSDRLRWCRSLTSELQIEALSANFWPRYRDHLLSYASSSLLPTYEANGVMKLRRPAFSNDHFVGRVLLNLVTPPNTTDSPKEHLFNTEGFWGPENSCLLIACESNYL